MKESASGGKRLLKSTKLEDGAKLLFPPLPLYPPPSVLFFFSFSFLFENNLGTICDYMVTLINECLFAAWFFGTSFINSITQR